MLPARRILPPLLFPLLLALCLGHARAADPAGDALRARYAELAAQLAGNQFGRPLYLDSVEEGGRLRGEAYAVVAQPYPALRSALYDATHWCDILILHINTKYCRASGTPERAALQIAIGKKVDQPLPDAYRVDFAYRGVSAADDYFRIELHAPKGPLGTSDFRIVLEGAPLPDGHSFIHLAYSYAYNFGAGVAMRTYLATIGRDKVGFTRQGNGYIGGVRGVVERNTMRYYLAIDAYLAGLAAPPAGRLDKRLQTWFAGTERYPRQLHEVDRNTYMSMKRSEVARMLAAPGVAAP